LQQAGVDRILAGDSTCLLFPDEQQGRTLALDTVPKLFISPEAMPSERQGETLGRAMVSWLRHRMAYAEVLLDDVARRFDVSVQVVAAVAATSRKTRRRGGHVGKLRFRLRVAGQLLYVAAIKVD
jgi:hypothetical protein